MKMSDFSNDIKPEPPTHQINVNLEFDEMMQNLDKKRREQAESIAKRKSTSFHTTEPRSQTMFKNTLF
jgi:hypothetical protein